MNGKHPKRNIILHQNVATDNCLPMKTSKILLSVFLLSIFGCEKLLIDAPPANDPSINFESFWTEFDRYYPYFLEKGVDWDSVYNVYQPQVNENTSDLQLFYILADMGLLLKDGHVNIFADIGITFTDLVSEVFLLNEPTNAPNYLGNLVSNPAVQYTTVTDDKDIGYIRISTFSGNNDNFLVIDDILELYQDKKGIIIDVRSNGGGSDFNGSTIASRFADEKRLFRLVTFRNGPEWNDFEPLTENHIAPEGNFQYNKPIVLLTNRRCFSACEGFTLMMRTFPHVTVVGDTTAGGTGLPLTRELPNGWEYRLSTWKALIPETMEALEGSGLPPDMVVQISVEDSIALRDNILEAAINLLQ